MPEDLNTTPDPVETMGNAPEEIAAERDFNTDPPTQQELDEWTEEYKIPEAEQANVGAAPVAEAVADAAPDLSVYEQGMQSGSMVPKGQELVPATEQLPEVPEQPATALEATEVPADTADNPDIEDAEFTEVEEGVESTEDTAEGEVEQQLEEVTETPQAVAQEVAPDTTSARPLFELNVAPAVARSVNVAAGEQALGIEQRRNPELEQLLELIDRLIAALTAARERQDTATIELLEKQLNDARAQQETLTVQASAEEEAEGGGEEPPTGTETAEEAAEPGTPIEGEFIPKGTQPEEQPALTHEDTRALEQKPEAPALEHQPEEAEQENEAKQQQALSDQSQTGGSAGSTAQAA
jgi:hypothetical protein